MNRNLGPFTQEQADNQATAQYVSFRLPCGHGDTLVRGWWGEDSLDALWEDRKCTHAVHTDSRPTFRTVVDPVDGTIRRVEGLRTGDYPHGEKDGDPLKAWVKALYSGCIPPK
jgi:hypothetical protein